MKSSWRLKESKEKTDLVLQEVGEYGYGAVDGVGVLARHPAAHVGGGGHRHALHARLEEV